VTFSEISQTDSRAELFDPDHDCSDDPDAGGDIEQRCAITETCTLRCYIRWTEGEEQPNDRLFNGTGEPL
jgi:hypothetical protein